MNDLYIIQDEEDEKTADESRPKAPDSEEPIIFADAAGPERHDWRGLHRGMVSPHPRSC